MTEPSYLEAAFKTMLRQPDCQDIPKPVVEYGFHPRRKWRFDFAWPGQKVAVEVEGITYEGGGRHQRVDGFVKDGEKYACALRLGWQVFRVPGPWIATTDGFVFDPIVAETIRCMLGLPNTCCPYCGDIMVMNREFEMWDCELCEYAVEPG